jgi:hypothetical protein
MAEEYKPIIEGAKAVELGRWGCGDECCCNAFQIRAVMDYSHKITPHWHKAGDWSRNIWESNWFNPCDGISADDFAELEAEVREACKHYGIPFVGGPDYWQWERNARRDL